MYSDKSQQETSTAFRKAEKQYQLHFEQILRSRKGKRRVAGVRAKDTDLAGVIDFSDSTTWQERVTPSRDAQGLCFRVHNKPGFCFQLGAVSPSQQWQLIVECLTQLVEPPATTNHSQQHGSILHLWEAAQQELHLEPRQRSASCSAQHDQVVPPDQSRPRNHPPPAGWSTEQDKGPAARVLLNKLRWASIGPNFDWSKRLYIYDQPYLPLPPSLIELSQQCAQRAAEVCQQACSSLRRNGRGPEASQTSRAAGSSQNGTDETKGPADLPHGRHHTRSCKLETMRACSATYTSAAGFQPDAALLNFYRAGDTLGGHCDDVEIDMSKPIVSISLGCDAIFLLGGESTTTPPTALYVRSGDAIVLAGESRRYFHGVPRILSDRPTALQMDLKLLQELDLPDGVAAKPFADFMSTRRINISIRETL